RQERRAHHLRLRGDGRFGDLHGGPAGAETLGAHGGQGRDRGRRDGGGMWGRAAQARLSPGFFIIARTDARAVHGLDDALRRAELYLKAGADGLFIEAPQSLEGGGRMGRGVQGVPQLANMVEGGGRTPILPPHELYRLGFAMVAYPTTLIFRVARTLEAALADLKIGRPAGK